MFFQGEEHDIGQRTAVAGMGSHASFYYLLVRSTKYLLRFIRCAAVIFIRYIPLQHVFIAALQARLQSHDIVVLLQRWSLNDEISRRHRKQEVPVQLGVRSDYLAGVWDHLTYAQRTVATLVESSYNYYEIVRRKWLEQTKQKRPFVLVVPGTRTNVMQTLVYNIDIFVLMITRGCLLARGDRTESLNDRWLLL